MDGINMGFKIKNLKAFEIPAEYRSNAQRPRASTRNQRMIISHEDIRRDLSVFTSTGLELHEYNNLLNAARNNCPWLVALLVEFPPSVFSFIKMF